MNLATCFGLLSHHQANSQTILKVHSVDVHIVGSQMFTNLMTIKGTNDYLVASIKQLSQTVVIKVFVPFIVIRFVNIWDPTMCTSTECTFSMVRELAS